ncbi:MAG: thioesterase II family protein [Myxococcota bacterium]
MSSPWLLPEPPHDPSHRLNLFCFPFAGGGTGPYRPWQQSVPDGVHVRPVQLPGRESRMREPAHKNMASLIDACMPQLHPVLASAPYALFGHSMGAAIAFEVARAMARLGGPEPTLLLLSARRAPQEPPPHPPLFALPKAKLIDELTRLYGPLPDALMRRPGLLDLFLPTMRADFQLIDSWQPLEGPMLTCDMTIVAAAGDAAVPAQRCTRWGEFTTGTVRAVTVEGGHFYLRDRTDVLNDLPDLLQPALAPLS